MNKEKIGILIGVIIAIIIFAVGFSLYRARENKNSSQNNESNLTPTPTESIMSPTPTQKSTPIPSENKKVSPDSLINSAKPQQCTISGVVEEGKTGTLGYLYTDGVGRGRVSYTYTAGQNQAQSNFLVLSDGIYSWFTGVGETAGFYYSNTNGESKNQENNSLSPIYGNVDMECKVWEVDESQFEIPNIEFRDTSVIIPGR